MAIYNEIIKTLGENLVEYNVGAWALFRDQMATEISSQYIFGNGRKPDESLLEYSKERIKESNKLVKGVNEPEKEHNVPRAKFTYYTDKGPMHELVTNPTLPEPETDVLHITSDKKPDTFDDNTQTRIGGNIINEVYDEKNGIEDGVLIDGLGHNFYSTNISNYENGETLLSKTNRWFKEETKDYISNRFATLISRFHTDDSQISIDELEGSVSTQAFSCKYGLSRGRNLRKKEVTDNNGYEDPYCRVWTWHKQYHRLVGDTMRPLKMKEGDEFDLFAGYENGPFGTGRNRLKKYGSMYDNGGSTIGLVNITPSMDKSAKTYSDSRNVSVEHCMFSIENLAWKGTYGNWEDITETNGLSREQKGPLGGRIMWFPPYDIKFNESSEANWQSNEFIGRGEPIYTYANTTRNGTLSFKLLIDHPAILDYWHRRSETDTRSGTDELDSKEQEMLRFFAGCEILKPSSTPKESADTQQKQEKEQEKEEASNLDGEKVVQFFVFYPNNYSGKSDGINKPVVPMEYLMNGVGTNKYTLSENVDDYNKNKFDLESNCSIKITEFGQSQQVGGYEMRPNVGISIIKNFTPDNHIVDINYDGKKIKLVKMVGNKAQKSSTGTSKTWNKRRYYYRVDNEQDVLNQVFEGDDDNGAVSYIDKESYQLNSVNYTNAISQFDIKNTNSTYSFAEVFVALEGDKNGIFNGLYREDKVAELKSILNGDKGKINEIICKGRASSQGNNSSESTNNKRNKTLSRERAITVQNWLKTFFNDSSIKYSIGDFTVDQNKSVELKDSNDYHAKLNRFAFIEIRYGGGKIENTSETTGNDSVSVTRNSTSEPITDDKNSNGSGETIKYEKPVRYDNEANFFKKLCENEPFMAKLLSERIKNFDPVFHSMSPEGFNARLTFLNQCMRQGPTVSDTDTKTYNANNLAFGRPPVCVLRIGDFYNTKIIIRSMTKDYDPLVWDLNQEGIGVMPMIANITLNFSFIGGSDLGGPIQRLQNATSFNYYANTSVYDNRAEEIEYENGKFTNFKAYTP